MTKKIQIPRQSDGALISGLSRVSQAAGHKKVNINVGGFVAFNDESIDALSPSVAEIAKRNNHIIDGASINRPGFSLIYYRGGSGEIRSPILDEVHFIFNDQKGATSNEDKVAIIEAITSSFLPVELSAAFGGDGVKEQGQIVASHISILERLESTSLHLINSGDEFRRSIENEYIKRAEELDERFQKRISQLDESTKVREGEIRERELELDRQKREFDNRENTHVRRDLRTQILDEVKRRTEEFRLSGSTNAMRSPIHAVLVLLIVALGTSAIYFASHMLEMIANSPANTLGIIVLAVKQIAVSVGFGFAVVFYVRWMNAWASTHAEGEFKVRQFQLDIERASWVVETALEWKSTPEGKMPPELLESITRGLFSGGEPAHQDIRPADELASALFGSAAKVRVTSGNSEVELDAKKLRSTPNIKGA
ncbi:MAG: hypothetical protein AABY68_13020 [Pseudomonadota bacterium]